MEKIRVFLVDSKTLYREGVRAILSAEQDIEVIGEAQQDEGTFSGFQAVSSDVVILAPKPPIVNSLKLVRQMKLHSPMVPVILLGEAEDEELLFLGIKVGAAAYLTYEATPEELIDAIRRTFRGEYLINESLATNPQVASRILKAFQNMPLPGSEIESLLAPLSPREIEVLSCIAKGNSNRDIGHTLGIAEQTVKNHITSILRKLIANDRTHAVVIALRQGLITVD